MSKDLNANLFELAQKKHENRNPYETRTGDWDYKFVTMKRVKKRPTKAEKILNSRVAGYEAVSKKSGYRKPGSQSGRK